LAGDIQDCDKKEKSEFLIVVCLDAVLQKTFIQIVLLSQIQLEYRYQYKKAHLREKIAVLF
jgi:hypothetical protein